MSGRAQRAGFFADADWDFEVRLALGETHAGSGDPGEILAAVGAVPDGDLFRARPYGTMDCFDAFSAVLDDMILETAASIATPLWAADPEDEQFWPGRSAQLASLVAGAHAEPFTAAEGANSHCQPMGRAVFEQRAFDWLDGVPGR